MREETSSLKRILEKYIEKSCLRQFFFTFRNNFVAFHQREPVFGCERGRGEMLFFFFFFFFWSAENVMKTNWQAVTIYLSCCRSALTRRGKTGPGLIQPGLHSSCASLRTSPHSPRSFSTQRPVVTLNWVFSTWPLGWMTWAGVWWSSNADVLLWPRSSDYQGSLLHSSETPWTVRQLPYSHFVISYKPFISCINITEPQKSKLLVIIIVLSFDSIQRRHSS